jgi:hypothetical protein
MRKYLATIFGLAIGIATAVFVAAQAEDDASRPGSPRREGGA